jgi:putative membrane protein
MRSFVASLFGLGLVACLGACGARTDRDQRSIDRGGDRGGTGERWNTPTRGTIAYGTDTDRTIDASRSEPMSRTDVSETGTKTDRDAKSIDRDVEALAFVAAVDEHEVLAAGEALKKTTQADVTDFAKSMQREHGKHADATRELAKTLGLTLTDPDSVVTLKDETMKERSTLAGSDAASFDKAYADAMVKDHQDALKKIDEFLANVQRDEVRSHLRSTRDAVENHLEMARKLAR